MEPATSRSQALSDEGRLRMMSSQAPNDEVLPSMFFSVYDSGLNKMLN